MKIIFTSLVAGLTLAASANLWAACQANIEMNDSAPVGTAGHTITHVPMPKNDTDVASKAYVDAATSLQVSNYRGSGTIVEVESSCRNLSYPRSTDAEYAGVTYTDWRLPTLHEAIVAFANDTGTADGTNASTSTSFHWTSTPYKGSADTWITYNPNQSSGFSWLRRPGDIEGAVHYRCVRGTL